MNRLDIRSDRSHLQLGSQTREDAGQEEGEQDHYVVHTGEAKFVPVQEKGGGHTDDQRSGHCTNANDQGIAKGDHDRAVLKQLFIPLG